MLWLYYCLFRIYHISRISRTARVLIALPAVVLCVLVIATVPGGIAFRINENNEYFRGIAFYASYAVGYIYVLPRL